MRLNPRPLPPDSRRWPYAATLLTLTAAAVFGSGCSSGGQSGDLNSSPATQAEGNQEGPADPPGATNPSATTNVSDAAAPELNAEHDGASDPAAPECDDDVCRQALFGRLCVKTSTLDCATRNYDECVAERNEEYLDSVGTSADCATGYIRTMSCHADAVWSCEEGRESSSETCGAIEQQALGVCQNDFERSSP
jgi:hypothetical protein